ncbi:MAG: hypothetical protein QFC55_07455 [Chloroflexota bacterium]|nr:hypothetical protein [Chloroflexota bacterium]
MTQPDLDVAPPDAASRLRAAARRARAPLTRFITLRWVPLTAALLSLVLSVVAIYTATQQPAVALLMPGQVRVAQGRATGGAYLYLQPAFVNTAQNNRVEVIRGMSLHVTGPATDAGAPSADLTWTQQLRLVTDAASGELSYEYVADAMPLVVSPSNAASPLALFEAPHGWFFAAGTYEFTLTADRVVAGSALTATFNVTLSADNVAFLDQPGPDKFLELPIR